MPLYFQALHTMSTDRSRLGTDSTYFKFLAKKGYMEEPLPAGDEVRAMIREHQLGAMIEAAVEPARVKAREGAPNLIVILADDMGIGDIGAFRELYPGGLEDVPMDLKDLGYHGDIAIQLAH